MMRIIHILLLIIFTAFSHNGFAQILNADKFGKNTDTTKKLSGLAEIGFNINKQKDLIYSSNTSADISYSYNRNVLIFAGSFNLFRSGNNSLINGGFAHLRYRIGYDNKLTPEFFAQIQYDAVRGLRERELLGSSLRYRLLQSDKGYMYVAGGLMYEREIWDYSGVEEISIDSTIQNNLVKFTGYVSLRRKLAEHVAFNFIGYYQARPDKYFLQPRISGEAQLAFRITKRLGFSIYGVVSYDEEPPVPIENLYYTIRNKLTINF